MLFLHKNKTGRQPKIYLSSSQVQWLLPIIPTAGKRRQEDCLEFKANLGHKVRLLSKRVLPDEHDRVLCQWLKKKKEKKSTYSSGRREMHTVYSLEPNQLPSISLSS